jgi:hypothetical protein
VLVFHSLVIFQLFVVVVGSVSLPRGLCWFIPGVAGRNSMWHFALTYLVSQMSPKQVWRWQLAAAAALLFSQCNVAWRNFLWARGSGCQSFDSPWCFISAKCGSSISARFLIHRAPAVCYCTLAAILDPQKRGFSFPNASETYCHKLSGLNNTYL